MQDLSGKRLGAYELRERMGRGGMAEVYLAYQPSMDRQVAVKVMLAHLTDDDEFIERFRREAQAVGKLRHPHIVDIFDFGAEDGAYYMAMEYIRGGSLKELISTRQKLSADDALRIGSQLADALAYAHQSGMIHRDLKPANVMFTDNNYQDAILTDFGIARIMNMAGLTGTSGMVGTPAYMSPEAGQGQPVDERTDIYALGIMLYEMLTGVVPYDADTPLAVVLQHIQAPLPTRQQYGDDIPLPVENIILRCLAKERENRFERAADLKQAIDKARDEISQTASTEIHTSEPEPPPATPAPSPMTDKPTTIGAAVAPALADTPSDERQPTASRSLPVIGMSAGVLVVLVLAIILAVTSGNNNSDDEEEILDANAQSTVTEASPEPTEIASTTLPTEAINDADEITVFANGLTIPYESDLPPNPNNLNLYTGISPIMDEVTAMLLESNRTVAIEHVQRVLDDNPTDLDALFAMSQIYSSGYDEEQKAVAYAEQMIDANPDSAWGYVALSDAHLVYPDYSPEKAREAIQQIAGTHADNPHVLWRVARLSDWDTQEQLTDTAELDGANGIRYITYMGGYQYEIEHYVRAIPYLYRLYTENIAVDDYDVPLLLMGSLILTDQTQAAYAIAQQRASAADTAEAFANLAFVAFRTQEYEQAREWANTATALKPGFPEAEYIIALLEWYQRRNAAGAVEALAVLDDKLEPVYSTYINAQYQHFVTLDKARIYADAGRTEEAIEHYSKVIEENSYTAWLYEERADAYIDKGDYDAAQTDLRTAYDITEDADYKTALLQRLRDLSAESSDD